MPQDVWIRLICRRYRKGYANNHWRSSGHCYSQELLQTVQSPDPGLAESDGLCCRMCGSVSSTGTLDAGATEKAMQSTTGAPRITATPSSRCKSFGLSSDPGLTENDGLWCRMCGSASFAVMWAAGATGRVMQLITGALQGTATPWSCARSACGIMQGTATCTVLCRARLGASWWKCPLLSILAGHTALAQPSECCSYRGLMLCWASGTMQKMITCIAWCRARQGPS